MRSLREAQREVIDRMTLLPEDEIQLESAAGLVLAADVRAPHPVPPFANSGMDGFAVRAGDVSEPPVVLEVIEDVPAGSVATRAVESGTAIRIMTGAPMPDGADAVVIVEDSDSREDGTVELRAAASRGDHVRPAGGDIEEGAVVLTAGTRLSAAHLGVLASIGVAEPLVRRRPVVAVASTGDELVPASSPGLRPGSIHDSNRPMLRALLEGFGVEVLDLGIIPDDARLLRARLGEAAAAADAVVTSGGVSMGEHDLVKAVLGELGTVEFWRVAMQPAKPFAFGVLDSTPFFGLPGNPVSVFVAYEQFLRPALLRRMGADRLFRPRVPARLAESVATNPGKEVFLRVAAASGDRGTVRLAGGQGSNVLSALAASDGLAVIPVGTGTVDAGETVDVEWFRSEEDRSYEEVFGG